jgi:hypothetical protein
VTASGSAACSTAPARGDLPWSRPPPQHKPRLVLVARSPRVPRSYRSPGPDHLGGVEVSLGVKRLRQASAGGGALQQMLRATLACGSPKTGSARAPPAGRPPAWRSSKWRERVMCRAEPAGLHRPAWRAHCRARLADRLLIMSVVSQGDGTIARRLQRLCPSALSVVSSVSASS